MNAKFAMQVDRPAKVRFTAKALNAKIELRLFLWCDKEKGPKNVVCKLSSLTRHRGIADEKMKRL